VSTDVIAPQQRRSRETLAKLLKATVETLQEHGLDGATIPRIAKAAGVAPASVYRRFRDRKALLRAAFLAVLERSAAANREGLRIERFEDRSFEGVANAVVAALIEQYRAYGGLLRAASRFFDEDDDGAFKAKAVSLIAGNFAMVVDLMLAFRSQVAHADPKRAITFALLAAATAIEVRALDPTSMWHELLPISDRELQSELVRSFLAYLRTA